MKISDYITNKNPNQKNLLEFIDQMTHEENNNVLEYLNEFEKIKKTPEIIELYYDKNKMLVVTIQTGVTFIN